MQKRNLTIYNYTPYIVDKVYPSRPQIIIQDRWLENLGVSIGEKVTLTCEEGRIIIEKTSAFTAMPENNTISMVAEADHFSYGEE